MPDVSPLERYLEMHEKAAAGDKVAEEFLKEGLYAVINLAAFEDNMFAKEILVAFDIPYRGDIDEWKKIVEEKKLVYYDPNYKPKTPEEEDAKTRYYSAKEVFKIRHRSKWQEAIDKAISPADRAVSKPV